MIRLFEFRDLDKIMNIWLEGNLEAHSFIDEEYWNKHFDSVKSVLPNACLLYTSEREAWRDNHTVL